jgi:formyltetrahydrofolate deformylase
MAAYTLIAVMQTSEHILTLNCADRPGIVATVSGMLAHIGCNIEESSQYGDPDAGKFFMRIRFTSPQEISWGKFCVDFRPIAREFAMQWQLQPVADRQKVMIMVSKMDHCLNDLIYRYRTGNLPMNIACVVSNHQKNRQTVEREGMRYEYMPVNKNNTRSQEQRLREIISSEGVDLIVLARYMQVLSEEMANDFFGRIINIHHSFLPSFKGAKPYHRAHARGVKLIGATAHYVTPELDGGPIIEQETERVTHSMGVTDLIAAGRDIERRVLARAVKYHLEHRVLINGAKTVVFNST